MKKIKDAFNSFFSVESIAMSITGPIILCLILGIFLDKIFNTQSLLTIIFTVLGSFTTLYNIFKDSIKEFFMAVSTVFSITGPIILFLFIGIFFDKTINTKGLLTIIFTVLGIVMSLHKIYKLAGVKNDKKMRR